MRNFWEDPDWTETLRSYEEDPRERAAIGLREVGGRGWWLEGCDVDADNGRGTVSFVPDIGRAKSFATAAEAAAYWQRVSTVRPLRRDGKPNRPLTAFTLAIEPLV